MRRAIRFALVLSLVINAPWTIFVAFFSLVAESGGKDPSATSAAFAVWALVEIVLTARRSLVTDVKYERARAAGAFVCASILVARPALDLIPLGLPLPRTVAWKASTIAVSFVVIVCARVLRLLSRDAAGSQPPSP
jgi:hypothetical protein